ncbi:hypothetical protein EDB85DRAFT_2158710 [Lactarius pseudohatsudake]|nr:hypothetical protein EDB85DRAFT_2158710 [Lactarius pseudohatsudake]
MKSVFFLAAIATPLIALAEPGGSPFAELVRRQPGSNLHARSNIDPSSVSKECQSTCTPIIKTLDACNSVASCECTQANFDALGTCLNCLQALSGLDYSGYTSTQVYVNVFQGACSSFGFELNDVWISASPTGIASTGDPLSILDAPAPTSGATQAVTPQEQPLIPTRAAGSAAKAGGAVGLSAPRSLEAGAVVAVAAVAIFMGGLPL